MKLWIFISTFVRKKMTSLKGRKPSKSFVKRIKHIIESGLNNCTLLAFGSFCSKFYLPNSDIDAVLISGDDYSARKLMKKVKNIIKKNKEVFSHVEFLSKAKIPLIKFVESESKIEFDLSFNQKDGIDMVP